VSNSKSLNQAPEPFLDFGPGSSAPKRRKKLLRFAGYTALALFGIVVAIATAIWIINPGPRGRIVIATGGADGAYTELAETYKAELARYGVKLEIRNDLQGVSSVSSLLTDGGPDMAHAAIIKGGVAGTLQGRLSSAADQMMHDLQTERIRTVGRLFYEPLWVFYRGPTQVRSLGEFKGRRIMVGSSSSGTRRIVTQLLRANGITPENSKFIDQEFPADGKPLTGDGADVAFVSLPPESKKVQALLRVPGILLMDFTAEADAYTGRFPYLSKVVLHRGSVEFEPDVPSADITLLATAPALIVRRDLHPALVNVLTQTAIHNPKSGFDRIGEPILFFKAGQFPNASDPEYDLSQDARLLYRSGEMPFLLRGIAPLNARLGIPFWVTAWVHQHATKAILLLIPLLSVLIPLIRILPMIYTWSVRRRLLYWYDKIKLIEFTLEHEPTRAQILEADDELDRIDRAVSRIKVPRDFSDRLYDLRGHIDLVRQRLIARQAPIKAAAE
jgi:uncharacterized protein